MDSCFSQRPYHEEKHKQSHPGIEHRPLIPFPVTIIVKLSTWLCSIQL